MTETALVEACDAAEAVLDGEVAGVSGDLSPEGPVDAAVAEVGLSLLGPKC